MVWPERCSKVFLSQPSGFQMFSGSILVFQGVEKKHLKNWKNLTSQCLPLRRLGSGASVVLRRVVGSVLAVRAQLHEALHLIPGPDHLAGVLQSDLTHVLGLIAQGDEATHGPGTSSVTQ